MAVVKPFSLQLYVWEKRELLATHSDLGQEKREPFAPHSRNKKIYIKPQPGVHNNHTPLGTQYGSERLRGVAKDQSNKYSISNKLTVIQLQVPQLTHMMLIVSSLTAIAKILGLMTFDDV